MQAAKEWGKGYKAAYDEAKKNGKTIGFKYDKPSPLPSFSPRFLAIAEQNPEGPDAIEAIKMTLQTSFSRKPDAPLETRAKALKILEDHYVKKPQIKGVLKIITIFEDKESKAAGRRRDCPESRSGHPGRGLPGSGFPPGEIARFAETVKDPKQLAVRKGRGQGIHRGTSRQGRTGEVRAR